MQKRLKCRGQLLIFDKDTVVGGDFDKLLQPREQIFYLDFRCHFPQFLGGFAQRVDRHQKVALTLAKAAFHEVPRDEFGRSVNAVLGCELNEARIRSCCFDATFPCRCRGAVDQFP